MEDSTVYELAVIGGGIAGAAIARDAALRGVSTVLLEKDTFGGGTSSKSSKLIHGGLRYLETAWRALKRGNLARALKDFNFVRLSLRETHTLARTAPGLVRPIRLLLPLYRQSHRSRASVYFGTWFYGLLSRLAGGRQRTQILRSAKDVLDLVPSLNPDGLIGGAVVWDHTTEDQELVRALIGGAAARGVRVLENCLVKSYRFEPERKLFIIDAGGRNFHAKKLVNAAGPWVDRVRARGGETGGALILPVAGAHLEFKRFTDVSVILEAEDKRLFFVIDTGKRSRVGTTERVHGDPDHIDITDGESDYLLRALAKYFPGAGLTGKDILSSDAGIRPLVKPKSAVSPTEVSREHAFVTGTTGAVHVLGVKLTDGRRAAEELLDRLFPGTHCSTASEPL